MIDCDIDEQLEAANKYNRKLWLKKDMYSPVTRVLREVRLGFIFQTQSIFSSTFQALKLREVKYHEYRYLIKDLFLYCWFLAIVVYLCHQLRHPYTYEVYITLKSLFIDGFNLFPGFKDIHSHEE